MDPGQTLVMVNHCQRFNQLHAPKVTRIGASKSQKQEALISRKSPRCFLKQKTSRKCFPSTTKLRFSQLFQKFKESWKRVIFALNSPVNNQYLSLKVTFLARVFSSLNSRPKYQQRKKILILNSISSTSQIIGKKGSKKVKQLKFLPHLLSLSSQFLTLEKLSLAFQTRLFLSRI